MWKPVAEQFPSFQAVGHLKTSLCMAKMGQWESSFKALSQFDLTWNYWFVVQPSECPLSEEQYLEHREIFQQVIDEFKELTPSEDAQGEMVVNLAKLELLCCLNADVSRSIEILHEYSPTLALKFLMRLRFKKWQPGRETKSLNIFRKPLSN
jgi:hypothetical protein